jgi:hypothetical protein
MTALAKAATSGAQPLHCLDSGFLDAFIAIERPPRVAFHSIELAKELAFTCTADSTFGLPQRCMIVASPQVGLGGLQIKFCRARTIVSALEVLGQHGRILLTYG